MYATILNVDDAYKIANDIAQKSWQRSWDHDSTGRYTYHLILTVGTKVLFPDCRDIGISYARLLLHDTMLKSDSFRTSTSDTPLCDCGYGEETVEHYLLDCCLYVDARREMMNYIQDTGVLSNSEGKLTVPVNDLLAPSSSNFISKKNNSIVKAALFQFIADTKRNL